MAGRPYEVVCRDTDPEWLEHRKRYLTASGVAAMLGKSPWVTAESYIESKRSGGTLVPNHYMLHGRYDEAHNMRKFTWITGLRTRSANLFMASTRWPGLACTIDGLVTGHEGSKLPVRTDAVTGHWINQLRKSLSFAPDNVGLIEMKQTSIFSGRKAWLRAAVPPEHYRIQLQVQLHVTGKTWGVLCAQVGSADMKAFYVMRDDSHEFLENLDGACARFRREVDRAPVRADG